MTSNERFEGTLQKWIEHSDRRRFGFAVMGDGKEVYVNEKDVRKTDLTRFDVGSRISFRLRPPKSDQQRFLDRLNAGAYRDVLNMNHRNPRCIRGDTRGLAL